MMAARPNIVPIAIFAREPIPAQTKTRLIPLLGAEGAAAFHAKLVEHALTVALEADLGPVELWVAGDSNAGFFQHMKSRYGIELRVQSAGDLGQRMAAVFAQAEGPQLLMGSDCPVICPRLLRNCAQALRDNAAVLLPAEDGGYGLIGLQKLGQPTLQDSFQKLFQNVEWGSDGVMARSREILRTIDLPWSEPAVIWDLDRPADWERLRQDDALYQKVMGFS